VKRTPDDGISTPQLEHTRRQRRHYISAWGEAPGTGCVFLLQANGLPHIYEQRLMPQSLSQVILHLVFSTKDRQLWLNAGISERMHAYLATIVRDRDCEAYQVGGVSDHVHLAIRLGRTISQADLIEIIKTNSSTWIKKQGNSYRSFFWQRGYGAFSIGYSQLESLIHYIEIQKEHHRTKTFQEEYRELLNKYHVAFDERYMWD
jgi:putative transposase